MRKEEGLRCVGQVRTRAGETPKAVGLTQKRAACPPAHEDQAGWQGHLHRTSGQAVRESYAPKPFLGFRTFPEQVSCREL